MLARRRRPIGATFSTSRRTSRSSSSAGRRPTVLGEHGEPERVQRADPGVTSRVRSCSSSCACLLYATARTSSRRVAAVPSQVAQPFGQHSGLARARRARSPGPDPSRGPPPPAGQPRDPRSARTDRGRRRACRRRSSPRGRSPRPPTSSGANGRRGPPSTHAGEPSGSTMSAGPSPDLGGTEAGRLAAPPPDRRRRSGRRRRSPRRDGAAGRTRARSAGPSVHGSTTSDVGSRKSAGSTASSITTGSRLTPALVQPLHRRGRVSQHGVVDGHDRCADPGRRDRTARAG